MVATIPCVHCIEEQKQGGQVVFTPITDSCIYNVTCPNGHDCEVILRIFKFDILFEGGLSALRDGYSREAVTSFAVALERFYEFSIQVLLMDKFIDRNTGHMNEDALKRFDKLWRTPLKLSERQLGAFYTLYFNEFDESPLIFDESFSKKIGHMLVTNPVNFRNKIVHEGHIPTYNEALQYGEAVYEYIAGFINTYRETDKGYNHIRLLEVVG